MVCPSEAELRKHGKAMHESHGSEVTVISFATMRVVSYGEVRYLCEKPG